MNTTDTNFYTVKQIDDFLNTDEVIAQSTSDNCKWFALQHTRNILIDRLKTRLAIANGCDSSIPGIKRAEVMMDAAFAQYEQRNKRLGIDVNTNTALPIPEVTLRNFIGELIDKVAGVHDAKFVFTDKYVAFKFGTVDTLVFSILFHYSMPERMVACVDQDILPNNCRFELHAASMPAFGLEQTLQFLNAVHNTVKIFGSLSVLPNSVRLGVSDDDMLFGPVNQDNDTI